MSSTAATVPPIMVAKKLPPLLPKLCLFEYTKAIAIPAVLKYIRILIRSRILLVLKLGWTGPSPRKVKLRLLSPKNEKPIAALLSGVT